MQMSIIRKIFIPPVVLVLNIVLMLFLHLYTPLATIIPQPSNWIGLLPVALGMVVAKWHLDLFRRLTTEINTFGEPKVLTTAGLFAHTRNPIYLSMLVVLIGIAMVIGSLSSLLGPVTFFFIVQFWYIPVEEKVLLSKFGTQYQAYSNMVPRWLF